MMHTLLLLACGILTACSPKPPTSAPQQTKASSAETNTISWEQAIEMIKSGQVRTVVQAHSLYVGLITTNNISYHTKEPTIDAVFHMIREHAPNKIMESTE